MPLYEYHCAEADRTVEVRHGMSETLTTWGELCASAGLDPGDTPRGASVERLMSAPVPLTARQGTTGRGRSPCGAGCACAADG